MSTIAKINSIGILLLCFFISQTHAFSQEKVKATILEAMGPAGPGETVLLTGDWPVQFHQDSATGVEVEIMALNNKTSSSILEKGKWTRTKAIQLTDHSLKFIIPTVFPMGVYACRVVSLLPAAFVASEIVYLNEADTWWLQGDIGASSSTAGGWLRIFGKALYFNIPPKVRLIGTNQTLILEGVRTRDKGGYAFQVPLPPTLPNGPYKVQINNGLNASRWTAAGNFNVVKSSRWKQDVYNITQFKHTVQNSQNDDWTDAFHTALSKAATNGGGIIYFPRGRYILNDMFTIPPYVTLRGEGEGIVNLYWRQHTTAFPSLLKGTDNFSIEDIGLYITGLHHDIILGNNNVTIKRVRIRADAYYRHGNIGVSNTMIPVTESNQEMGAAIKMLGSNITITDCDIYHSTKAIEMYHVNGAVIARNKLNYGQSPMQLYGISNVIIEDNVFQGTSLWAGGIGISLHGASVSCFNIYFAHNESKETFGGDREAVTTDGHGTAYLGKIQSANGTSLILEDTSWFSPNYTSKDVITFSEFDRSKKEKNNTEEGYHGVTIYILSGKGVGQYRTVEQYNKNKIVIDAPWKIVPDQTSIVSIGKFQGRSLFIGNKFQDAGTSIQLYPPNINCIVAENQTWRVQSMNCSADMRSYTTNPKVPQQSVTAIRVEPSWYNQFIDNHIWEGMGWDSQAQLSITGNQAPITLPQATYLNIQGAMYHIIRSNILDNNATISVVGSVADVVIEKNTISNVPEGIRIKGQKTPTATYTPSRIFINKNTFKNVGIPLKSN